MESELRSHFERGLELFNAGQFFDCHDELEEVWAEFVGPQKRFYQGLIHAAVSLFHFGEGNLGGALKMYRSCRRYLTPFAPAYEGIDLAKLLDDLELCFSDLTAARGAYPAEITLNPQRVPRIVRFREET